MSDQKHIQKPSIQTLRHKYITPHSLIFSNFPVLKACSITSIRFKYSSFVFIWPPDSIRSRLITLFVKYTFKMGQNSLWFKRFQNCLRVTQPFFWMSFTTQMLQKQPFSKNCLRCLRMMVRNFGRKLLVGYASFFPFFTFFAFLSFLSFFAAIMFPLPYSFQDSSSSEPHDSSTSTGFLTVAEPHLTFTSQAESEEESLKLY